MDRFGLELWRHTKSMSTCLLGDVGSVDEEERVKVEKG